MHEFQHRFQGAPARFRVTSVKGHVFNLDFEQQYQSWDRPPKELFAAGTVKIPSSGAVISHIRQEATGCAQLVLFLDCDREGENICFEVMHIALPVLRRSGGGRRIVHRAFFSAVSAASIAAALGTESTSHRSRADSSRE